MSLIRLTGHIAGPPERRAAFAAGLLPAQIPLTRAEPGSLNFDVTPDPVVADRWHLAERFDSRQAVEAHKAHGARADASARAKASADVPPCIRVAEVDG